MSQTGEHSLPESDPQRTQRCIPITYLGRLGDSTPGLSTGAPGAREGLPPLPRQVIDCAAQPPLFRRIRWKRQVVVGLKVTLTGKKSAATQGSSRTDGDVYLDNRITVKELLILILLGATSSCRQDTYFPVVPRHIIQDMKLGRTL